MTFPIRSDRAVVSFALAVLVGLATFVLPAAAETEEELLAKRTQWQERYRVALSNRVILQDNIEKLLHDYAQAQRRNYPRGGAREAFLARAEEQKALLADTEREIQSIQREARAAGIPPGWLAEVEDEDLAVPAAPSGEDERDGEDREGRNPRFFRDEDPRTSRSGPHAARVA